MADNINIEPSHAKRLATVLENLVLPRITESLQHFYDPSWWGIVPKDDLEWMPIAKLHLEGVIKELQAASETPAP
jgi:hypothetical protein